MCQILCYELHFGLIRASPFDVACLRLIIYVWQIFPGIETYVPWNVQMWHIFKDKAGN